MLDKFENLNKGWWTTHDSTYGRMTGLEPGGAPLLTLGSVAVVLLAGEMTCLSVGKAVTRPPSVTAVLPGGGGGGGQ